MAAPLVATAIGGLIRAITVGFVAKTVLSLGFSVITFVGAVQLVDAAETAIESNLTGLPPTLWALLDIAQVDFAISFIFAAITFRFTYGLSIRAVNPSGGS
jgi:hypothetical protein